MSDYFDISPMHGFEHELPSSCVSLDAPLLNNDVVLSHEEGSSYNALVPICNGNDQEEREPNRAFEAVGETSQGLDEHRLRAASWNNLMRGTGPVNPTAGFIPCGNAKNRAFQWNPHSKQNEIRLHQTVRLALNPLLCQLEKNAVVKLRLRYRDSQLQSKELKRCSKHVKDGERSILIVPGAERREVVSPRGGEDPPLVEDEFWFFAEGREYIDLGFHCTGSCMAHTTVSECKRETKFWELLVISEGNQRCEERIPIQVMITLRNPDRLNNSKGKKRKIKSEVEDATEVGNGEDREELEKILLKIYTLEISKMPFEVLKYKVNKRRGPNPA